MVEKKYEEMTDKEKRTARLSEEISKESIHQARKRVAESTIMSNLLKDLQTGIFKVKNNEGLYLYTENPSEGEDKNIPHRVQSGIQTILRHPDFNASDKVAALELLRQGVIERAKNTQTTISLELNLIDDNISNIWSELQPPDYTDPQWGLSDVNLRYIPNTPPVRWSRGTGILAKPGNPQSDADQEILFRMGQRQRPLEVDVRTRPLATHKLLKVLKGNQKAG